jgi:hypothetical protein
VFKSINSKKNNSINFFIVIVFISILCFIYILFKIQLFENKKNYEKYSRNITSIKKKYNNNIHFPEDLIFDKGKYLKFLFHPMKAIGYNKIRIGRKNDGGYILLDNLNSIQNKIVYSIGINNECSFDLDMAEKGFQIFMYDHTIKKLPLFHKNFHWKKIGLSGVSNNINLYTLEDLIKINNHTNENNMILKIDCDLCEFDSLLNTPDYILDKFEQIVIEFHFYNKNEYKNYINLLRKINRLFQSIHIHYNNFDDIVLKYFSDKDRSVVHKTPEITYVNKKKYKFNEDLDYYPIKNLDYPNSKNKKEIEIGYAGIDY